MPLSRGDHLGPYEVCGLLGAGGMGEVYRARDPRLDREVAIKVLPEDVASDSERLRRFEKEAKAAGALNHSNVLVVYDVGTHEGRPYLVTELLEGDTLRERMGGPLPAGRAVEHAVQIARGLAAAHDKGIVHRDLKPENLFVTRDGLIKILDFGLAKLRGPEGQPHRSEADGETVSRTTDPGAVIGTAGYMSPEQVRGRSVDHRSDIFSFGAVLYEMLSGRRAFRGDSGVEVLNAILKEEPPDINRAESSFPPQLMRVLKRCLEKRPEDRFQSARDLAFDLEAVSTDELRRVRTFPKPEVAEGRPPYPGLAAFTEGDAEHFFGREAEIEALWAKLRRLKLLGLIGPSGAGKTSFVRAGLLPSRPEGWAAVHATPGSNPGLGLARALTPDLAGNAEAMSELLTGVAELSQTGEAERVVNATKRWRSRYAGALLVMDQLEELFTLNPLKVQESFARLLGRVASECDVHVVLSIRDDFLIRCSDHEPLAPVFESLTPLTALSREGLRRAVVEPAKKRGYRFEDEALVDEIVSTVEGVRGALPLLAFAVARLWEKRDREGKLLTRAAYKELAGVEGALAQHAEATMDAIGPERQGLVREIFRNLVTAQGTRAVIERGELLSAFADGSVAEDVLRQLIGARLVTSYEVEGKEGEPSHHRVEIVHESLLTSWPRLVRWQVQDEEGAILRDQLKQAAHLWEEKGRTSDLLWTGTAYQEYELWRGRYPGTLTALEEDFSQSMVHRARRQRRRRRAIAGAMVAASLVVATVTGVLWRRSEVSRRHAQSEALRAEAGKLLALGQTYLDADPTAALAYTRRSLELADTPEARRFAVEVLWRGPVARILPVQRMARQQGLPEDPSPIGRIALSPDGRWLATLNAGNRRILLFSREGGPARALPRSPDGNTLVLEFGPRSDLLITGGSGESLRFWSLPDLRELRSEELGGLRSSGLLRDGRLLTFTRMHEEGPELLMRAWPLPDGEPKVLGAFTPPGSLWTIDPGGTKLAYSRGRTVRVRALDPPRAPRERVLGSARDEVLDVTFAPWGDRLASVDRSGEVRIWPLAEGATAPLQVLQGVGFGSTRLLFDPGGRRLTQSGPHNFIDLWDLEAPPDAQPVRLGRPGPGWDVFGAFDPDGHWLAVSLGVTVDFWPLSTRRMRTLPGPLVSPWKMAFTNDGRSLVFCPFNEPARLWPLNAVDGSARDLVPPEPCFSLATHPAASQVLVGTWNGKVLLSPTGAGSPRLLLDRWKAPDAFTYPVAFDAAGRRVIASPGLVGGVKEPAARVLRVWDLESAQERVYSIAHLTDAEWWRFNDVAFAPDGSLYVAGQGGVRRLVLPADPSGTVSSETVYAAAGARLHLSHDGRLLLVWATQRREAQDLLFEEVLLFDLAQHTSRRITTHGERVGVGAVLDPSGRVVVTGDGDGVVRAGPVTGEEPHLLLGHEGMVCAVAVSPDGRWIASAGDDAVRLWPMPDVTKPPLHTLPYDELMAKLRDLTNLQVVADKASATGYKLEIGPFPGWETVPTW